MLDDDCGEVFDACRPFFARHAAAALEAPDGPHGFLVMPLDYALQKVPRVVAETEVPDPDAPFVVRRTHAELLDLLRQVGGPEDVAELAEGLRTTPGREVMVAFLYPAWWAAMRWSVDAGATGVT